MNEVILNTIFQFKRGLAEAWTRNNPILRPGEPGFELDTGKLKIGNGSTNWNNLEYFGGDFTITADQKSIIFNKEQLELAGFAEAVVNAVPRKAADGSLEWIVPDFPSSEEIEKIQKSVDFLKISTPKVKYEITNKPEEAIVDYRSKEIRVFCPKNTIFTKQNPGATGNPNMYYMAFKAYAPEGAACFKEGDRGVIIDELFTFDNEFAGTDEYGRNYSICWLALASYNSSDDSWTYFGKNSSVEKYIGWDYIVEWYDANYKLIGTDKIRINLSNEDCHNVVEDYYMGQYQKKTDFISVDRLINADNTILVFNGGSAENI